MKICFKCGEGKPLSEYYKHPKMGDGYLGKCKSCTKSDAHKRHLEKSKDIVWVESELERHRIKAQKARNENKASPASKDANRNWRLRNNEKYKAHAKVQCAIKRGDLKKENCMVCGDEKTEAHHEDYSRPLYVMWLCKKHHMQRHIELRKMERYLQMQINNKTNEKQ